STHILVGIAPDEIAVACERDATAVGHDLQAMTRELEAAINLRPQQAADVRAVRVRPAGIKLPAHRRATDMRIALEHQHVEPRLREECSGRQAVVACAHYDDVMTLHAAAPR